MNEKLYLFNPFNIKDKTNNELRDMYNEVYKTLLEEPNALFEYSHNIEVYANLNYILGECIARLTQDLTELKTEIEIKKAIKCVEERQNWNEENGKIPAMSYFEALGTRFCQENIKLYAEKECSLKRFKNAYESISEKMNALKKKMEAIRYEEFNQ